MFSEPVRVVDLGCYLDQAAYPPWGFAAKHVTHDQGAKSMANFFNLREFDEDEKVTKEDFPESLGLAWSHVRMSDHTGNHIDAPYHFGPTVAGEKAKTIDEVPLEWCSGPGIRLDFRNFDRKDIRVDDIKERLHKLEVELEPGLIPLLWTGADKNIDDDDKYFNEQAGLSPEGLHFFLDHGIKLVGIDAYAMDVSYETMQENFSEDDPQFFPLHFVGREREHMHLEKLVGLEQLPVSKGFYFVAMPIKLRGGSAGWVRPVAYVPERFF